MITFVEDENLRRHLSEERKKPSLHVSHTALLPLHAAQFSEQAANEEIPRNKYNFMNAIIKIFIWHVGLDAYLYLGST